MTLAIIACTASLCFACFQIGRIVGRGERTPEDKLWQCRLDNGYGPRS